MAGRRSRLSPGIILLLAGTVLLGLGLIRGEATVVLRYATLLCLACIGIGP
jgi:hypothetical protein